MGERSESMPPKGKPKRQQNLPSRTSPHSQHGSCSDGRFYGREDDAFWRLSFCEESVGGRTSRGVFKSVWYESDDELEIPRTSCQSCRSMATKMVDREDSQLFTNMISDIRKMRRVPGNVEALPKIDTCKAEKESKVPESKILPKEKVVKERGSTKKNQRILKQMLEMKRKSEKAEEIIPPESAQQDLLKWQPVLTIRTTERDHPKLKASGSRRNSCYVSSETRNFNLGTIEKDHAFAAVNIQEADGASAEWKNLKQMKIEELKGRKSLYVSRELQRSRTRRSSKARVQSPRTPVKVEFCKIKAIEDMKKAKMKTKKKIKEKATEERRAFESFAVVKFSFDLQQDFRDSMVEMIREKGITQPGELEDLLACYLTLNSDKYHDLIIKVFRQVWFDLNQAYFDPELQNEHCCYN